MTHQDQARSREESIREIDNFPYGIREIMTEWIPMSDGCRLAARLWIPEGAEATPVPAVLEYLPYRRRDGTAIQDSANFRYLAGHGFAGIRVDIRGTGDSDGLIADEYDHPELQDGKEVVAWIGAQPWCSGSVGMWGYSWGGFNSLQIAALQPPALKAIITLFSTDDRYADDCHYMGGCLLEENMEWGNEFLSNTTRPPDPMVVGERWREMWHERLSGLQLSVENWLRHQLRDSYWKHGSVCENYSQIKAAVYAIGGWADGYTNTVLRLLANLPGPRKGLIGPWGHAYPHEARPGPAIGFLQEAIRWWEHWLKGNDTGIMAEPLLKVWMQESNAPSATCYVSPGRWVAEKIWPSPRVASRRYALTAEGIADGLAREVAMKWRHPLAVGTSAAKWCPYGLDSDMSGDQRRDDGMSLCFDSAPLAEQLEILGAPIVQLHLAVDRPRAMLAVRLCDVAPDGTSSRITYGLINLTHGNGHDKVTPLKPGTRFTVRVQLCDIAHSFAPGHRLRVAISTSYWPIAWPAPEQVELTLFAGNSTLELPLRSAESEDEKQHHPFGNPEKGRALTHTQLSSEKQNRYCEENLATGAIRMITEWDKGDVVLHDIDLRYTYNGLITNQVVQDDPLSAAIETTMTQRLSRSGWDVRTEVHTLLTSTKDDLLLTATVDAYEAEMRVFTRSWASRIPRDGV